ncbi:MAG: hypothetical protein FWE63_03890 [Bacteroidales bacterium]|nr:hypothetical protein [Bacteroidales bacterium]
MRIESKKPNKIKRTFQNALTSPPPTSCLTGGKTKIGDAITPTPPPPSLANPSENSGKKQTSNDTSKHKIN